MIYLVGIFVNFIGIVIICSFHVKVRSIPRSQSIPKSSSLSSSSPSNNFIFVTCQAGSEKAVKYEISQNHPYFNPAYSRPGLITFKCTDSSPIDPSFPLKSTFAQTFGLSLGSTKTIEEAYFIALSLRNQLQTPLRLHVYGRDEPGTSSEHPLAIQDATDNIIRITQKLLEMGKVDKIWLENRISPHFDSKLNPMFISNDQDHVLNVIVPTGKYKDDPLFIGYHKHIESIPSTSSILSIHSPYPGGNPQVVLPPDSPSRAYMKMYESLIWSNVILSPGENVVEIGSAPGGGSLVLLRKGLNVIGIDPCPPERQHASIVSKHSNFKHIRAYVDQVDRSQLPDKVDWIFCDANQSPQTLLPEISRLVKEMRSTLKGVFITLKFNDVNWKDISLLSEFLDDIKFMGMIEVEAKQLPSNRQEVLAFGRTALGRG